MYKPRLEFEVGVVINVYAQWLILHVGSSELLECLLSCNNLVLMRASFRNLRKVFSISRSTCTCPWLVDRVEGIISQENSNKQKTNQSQERFKVVKENENATINTQKCLKPQKTMEFGLERVGLVAKGN